MGRRKLSKEERVTRFQERLGLIQKGVVNNEGTHVDSGGNVGKPIVGPISSGGVSSTPLPLGGLQIPTVKVDDGTKEKSKEIKEEKKNENEIAITTFISPEERPKLEKGLADIMHQDVPRWLENIVIILRAEDRCQIHPVSEGRALLWAKFALPVLEKYFPQMSSMKAFLIFTFITLGSMVEVKKLPPKKVD